MASLSDVLSAAIGVKDAVVAGHFADAWEKSLTLQQFAIEAARAAGFQAAPGDPPRADVHSALCECEAACAAANPPVGADEVGKLGDGKILELLKVILPLILSLFA